MQIKLGIVQWAEKLERMTVVVMYVHTAPFGCAPTYVNFGLQRHRRYIFP